MALLNHTKNQLLSALGDPEAVDDLVDNIDSQGAGDIKRDGTVPFIANQSMGGFKLTNLGTPTVNTDAATKQYVDNSIAAIPATTPGGADTQVQFNDSGAFGGDAGFTYNKTLNALKVGSGTTASAGQSIAIGTTTIASGANSLASGTDSAATNANSVAFGSVTNAGGLGAFAANADTSAAGHRSAAFGNASQANGNDASSFGRQTRANADNQTVVGQFNTLVGTAGAPASTDQIFTVGNGANSGARNDALAILRDGSLQVTASVGASGDVLTSNGVGSAPSWQAPSAGSNVLVFTSSATVGGAASEVLTVTGLLATDTIIAVTQKTGGGAALPLLSWSTQANNAITGIWSADPGSGAVLLVAVTR